MGKGTKINVAEENPKTKFHLGTFTAPPPLCLGDPYVSKAERSQRQVGKQFSGGTQIFHQQSRVFPGTLDPPKLLWSEQKDKYEDKTSYLKTVPPERKKNGFMSSDFPRRDEFSNTIRTSQLRETLKKQSAQAKWAKAQMDARKIAHNTANSILEDENPGLPSLHLPTEPLFDVVYRIPEASLRLARDDRQAGLYYKNVRRTIELAGSNGSHQAKPTRIQGDAAWVSVSLNGRPTNLLVTPVGEVLARKTIDGKHEVSAEM